jgi:hypothetical protein
VRVYFFSIELWPPDVFPMFLGSKDFDKKIYCRREYKYIEIATVRNFSKDSFGSHYFGLESKNSFIILIIICLATTKLVMEFIWNSMGFHFMPNLNTYWVPCHFCGFS